MESTGTMPEPTGYACCSETGDVDIVYADESLAALWETSAAAKAEMADQLPLVRRAVGPLPAPKLG